MFAIHTGGPHVAYFVEREAVYKYSIKEKTIDGGDALIMEHAGALRTIYGYAMYYLLYVVTLCHCC